MSGQTTTEIEKGLEGVVIGKSAITFIDGQKGILRYRGIDIKELAEKSTYEEVVYLLWNGKLPTRKELDDFKKNLAKHRPIPREVKTLLKMVPKASNPMDVARTAASLIATYPPRRAETFEESNRRKARELTATLPTIVAGFQRIRKNKPLVVPDPKLGHAGNFLYGMYGKKPDEVQRKAFDTMSILYADHEMNASTFAAVVTVSTLADLGGAVTSAVAALAGPLHGGSNQKVMEMLEKIGSVDRVHQYVSDELVAGRRVMGFGHRVYHTFDPRAVILKGVAEELTNRSGQRKWIEIARKLEDEVWEQKHIRANIEFYAAVVLNELGVPKDLMPAVFACNRVAGWIAHIYEQYADNRIIRPMTEYVGPAETKYVPIEDRS